MQLITAETKKMYIRHKHKANFTIMSKITLLTVCNKENIINFNFHIYVTGREFRLRKRQRGLDAFIVIRDSGMDAGRCTDELQCFWCACAVVFLLEDQSRLL